MRLFAFTLARVSGALLAAAVGLTLVILQASQPVTVGAIRPLPTVDPIANLIREHGCWRDAAPADMAGKFPTHSIVNGKYVGRRLTDLAFDQEVGHHPHGLTVSAFCR